MNYEELKAKADQLFEALESLVDTVRTEPYILSNKERAAMTKAREALKKYKS